jgi:heme-degrading monooxygenase HmoA
MIKRLVKLTFHPEFQPTFIQIFEDSKTFIRQMPGNQHLELLQDTHSPNIFFTLSHWQSETDLNNYRASELFKTTWAKTKKGFSDKPQAWTTEAISDVLPDAGGNE